MSDYLPDVRTIPEISSLERSKASKGLTECLILFQTCEYVARKFPYLRHWLFMRSGLLCLFVLLSTAAWPQSISLPGHESLYYNIEWRLINAGKAKVELQQERSGWHIGLHLESSGLVSKLFRVEDDYSVNTNAGLCAENSVFVAHEGSRQRETKITFDGAQRHAAYVERDTAKNTVLLQKETEIPACVHDVIGALYVLRTLNLEPGQSSTMAITDGKKSVMAKVEAQGREDIKTPEGVFHTVRYEAYLFDDVLFRRSAHLNFWLTDDRRRLPVEVRVRMQFTIGTITLTLAKHE